MNHPSLAIADGRSGQFFRKSDTLQVGVMRYSIRNMAIWTVCCGCVFAVAQFVGLPLAFMLFLLCLFLLRVYEDGLHSAGIQSDRLRNFAGDVQPRSDDQVDHQSSPKMRGRGPALFLTMGGLLGCLFGAWLQGPYGDTTAAAMPAVWMLIGGIAFRFRSRDWPIDPRARGRQFGYIAIALIVLPISLVSLIQDSKERFRVATVGIVIGGTVSIGILASGRRRQQFSSGVEQVRNHSDDRPTSDQRDEVSDG